MVHSGPLTASIRRSVWIWVGFSIASTVPVRPDARRRPPAVEVEPKLAELAPDRLSMTAA